MGIRHRFRVDGRLYVYDAVTNQILQMAADLYHRLPAWERAQTGAQRGRAAGDFVELSDARLAGLLSQEKPRLLDPTATPAFAETLRRGGVAAVSLCVTEKCTLRCSYCPYTQNIGSRRSHAAGSMPWLTAKQAVDLLRENADGIETPFVSFYGGEPMLEFELIEAVAAYARKAFAPAPVRFNMTTNGTIMDREMARFLIAHNFYLIISLDGPPALHDRYREGPRGGSSHQRVMRTIALLKELSPEFFAARVTLNMVLAPPLDLAALRAFLIGETSLPPRRTVTMVDGDDTDFLAEHPYTPKDARALKALRRKAEQCLIAGRPEDDPLAVLLFKKPFLRLAYRNRRNVSGKSYIPTGQCLPGGHKLFADAKGRLHMCERIDEGRPIGRVETGIDPAAVKEALGPFYADALATCGDCYALRLCGLCLNDALHAGRFDKRKKDAACAEARRRLHNNLVSYVRIIERNPQAFDAFAPLSPQKSFGDMIEF